MLFARCLECLVNASSNQNHQRASSAMRSAILVPLTTLVFPMVAFGSFAGIPCCAAVLLYNLMCQCTPLNISSGTYADSNLEHWVRVIKIADPSCRIGLANLLSLF